MVAAEIGQIPWTSAPRGVLNAVGSGLVAQAVAAAGWLVRAQCGLSGHVMVRQFEPQRMSLECMRCGRRTPGWTFDARRA